ncbi:hypothetical protein JW824_12460 [bacterium]|nr:hypothetical protein [bacterium]RQV92090.1 MAG: hypothetical protein EH221_12470 [bacterium]
MQKNDTYTTIQIKLHQLRQKEKVFTLLRGSLNGLVMCAGIILFFSLLEALFYFSSPVRTLFFIGFLIGVPVAFGFWVIKPLFSLWFKTRFPDDDSLAIQVGRHFPRIKDRLADALQVFRSHPDQSYGTSSSMAEASLETVYEEVKSFDFRQTVSKKPLTRMFRIGTITALFCIIIFSLFPSQLGKALDRLSHPNQEFNLPIPFQLVLLPGNVQVIQGEDVDITVKADGKAPSEISLFLQEENTIQERILHPPYHYQIASIRRDIDYFIEADRFRSETCRIDVVQRPLVRTLQVTLTPPPYARMSTRRLEENSGEVRALLGTKIHLSVTANKTLSEASIYFEKEGKRQMIVHQQNAEGEFVVRQDDRYWIELTDTLELKNTNPIVYSIGVQPDYHPVARILFPAKNIDLDETMSIPLTLEGEDDFGLSLCQLAYAIHKGGIIDSLETMPSVLTLPFTENKPIKVLQNYTWNLEELGLYPEDIIAYRFEVWDNDDVSGPKRAQSAVYTARFPSLLEIFQEVEAEQSDQIESLNDIYSESEILREELEQIAEEMKSSRELEWEERKNLESMGEKQLQMEEEVRNLQERMADLIDRMEKNDLLSMETLEKYQELQKLFQEIITPELAETMKKLQEALDTVDQEQLKLAMNNFQLSQENFMKSIERTISILKKLRVEQKVDELVKRMDDLIERQERINRDLNQMKEETSSELVEREEKIEEDSELLRQEMDTLSDMMEELPGMPLSQLEAIMNRMDQENLSGQFSRMQQMMEAGQNEKAAAAGTGAQQTMESISEMMKEMQQNMMSDQKEKVANALNRASYRLLQLSRGQEDLMSQTSKGEVSESQSAEKQLSLLSGLNQVADSLVQLAQETFFVTPEMGRALGKAQTQMKDALQMMSQPGGQQGARPSQGQAMGALNETVMAIQEALEQLAGSGSGLGMEQYMAGLEKMSQMQLGINQQMMDLFQDGQLSLEEQAAMARLAAEQSAVKKAMEDLLREFGDRSEITGRLDQMVEDMESVIEDLEQQRADQETIERQERILSRLLDAQRSVRKRDYSRERESLTGEDVIRQSPEALSLEQQTGRERILRDILRLGDEGYTKDYQDLIRQYYERLLEEER